MHPQVQDSYDPPVTEHDLVEFERECGFPLPREYRDFLLAHNGGTIHDTAAVDGYLEINVFYGLNTGLHFDYSDLRESIKAFRGRISPDLLPIADTPTGDQVCLRIAGSNIGAIYWWDREDESNFQADFVADTFGKFMNSFELDVPPQVLDYEDASFFSAVTGDVDALAKRLSDRLDVDMHDSNGMSLLMHAATNCRSHVVNLLLQQGASMELQNPKGQTALFLATFAGSVDSVRNLLKAGANPSAVDARGESVLMESVWRSQTRIALLLIEYGANVNWQSPSGRTALSYCKSYYEVRYVRPLLIGEKKP